MYPIQTQDNLFHDGDGVTELGTIVTAEWLNDVQQSLLAVLAAAQKSPAKNSQNLLRDSINELIKRGIPNGSLTTKGIVQLSSAINSTAENLAATPKAVMDALASAMAGNLTLHGELGSKNLNDLIGQAHYGIHHQVLNGYATSDLNYPVQKAGTLLVLPSAYSGIQLYIPFDMSLIYIRNQWVANSALGPWRSIGGAEEIPTGAIAYLTGATVPPGWLKANGAAVSRTAYADLFAAIGTRYGAGNGSTTFNLPDLRGEFVRGWDDSRGVDAGRALGTHQMDALQDHVHATLHRAQQNNGGQNLARGAGGEWGTETMGVASSARTATETRPRNIALMAVIKI